MHTRRIFFYTLSFFFILWTVSGCSSEVVESRSSQIEQLDAQIQQLEEEKRGYESRALKHENQAEYLQFNSEFALETRRHLQIAEENRAKAAMVQQHIDLLKAKRAKLQ